MLSLTAERCVFVDISESIDGQTARSTKTSQTVAPLLVLTVELSGRRFWGTQASIACQHIQYKWPVKFYAHHHRAIPAVGPY